MTRAARRPHLGSRVGVAAAAAVVALAVAGCTGSPAPDAPAAPSPSPSSSAAPTPAPGESVTDALTVAPGRVGRAEAGMTQDEAAGTGLFDVDVTVDDVEGCERVEPLRWRAEYGAQLDVLTTPEGVIASLGVRGQDVRTAEGVGVGSTYGELVQAYGEALSVPRATGFGQTGVFVTEDDAWMGFLLDLEPGAAGEVPPDAVPVTFVEVTTGERPDLVRDGC